MKEVLNNLVIIEGNIAAGKTSALYTLYENLKPNCFCIEEPVTNNPYLAKFYENP